MSRSVDRPKYPSEEARYRLTGDCRLMYGEATHPSSGLKIKYFESQFADMSERAKVANTAENVDGFLVGLALHIKQVAEHDLVGDRHFFVYLKRALQLLRDAIMVHNLDKKKTLNEFKKWLKGQGLDNKFIKNVMEWY